MTTIIEIQEAVRALPEEDFREFSSCSDEYEEERWDRQIERDQTFGPLRADGQVRADFEAGNAPLSDSPRLINRSDVGGRDDGISSYRASKSETAN